MSSDATRARSGRTWTLERALFALAGTLTLVSVGLAVIVSPWFLIATAVVGISELMFVAVGECPASFVLRRVTGLRGCAR